MDMTIFEAWTLGVAVVAIIISIISLCGSIYFGLLDRAKLQIKSEFYPASEYGQANISIHIANSGRRPMIIRMWAGENEEGIWAGSFFGKSREGLRLDENEREDLHLSKDDLISEGPDDPIIISKLWIEDSLGKRYPIPNSETHVKQLLKS